MFADGRLLRWKGFERGNGKSAGAQEREHSGEVSLLLAFRAALLCGVSAEERGLFRANAGIGEGVEALLKLLAVGAVFGGLLVDGDQYRAQESGDGHVAAGGGEAGVLVELAGEMAGDTGHAFEASCIYCGEMGEIICKIGGGILVLESMG
jgi:hypothetical protein